METQETWERRLEAEGLAEEPELLSGFGRARVVPNAQVLPMQGRRELPAFVEAPGMPRSVGGVWRREDAVAPAITAEAVRRAGDLVRVLEQELAVLRMAAEGLSVREIAGKLELDRNRVHRTLTRVRARLEGVTA